MTSHSASILSVQKQPVGTAKHGMDCRRTGPLDRRTIDVYAGR